MQRISTVFVIDSIPQGGRNKLVTSRFGFSA